MKSWIAISRSWAATTGTLGRHQGAVVDRTRLRRSARDQAHQSVRKMRSFSERGLYFWRRMPGTRGVIKLPAHAVTLAYSERCPVQAVLAGMPLQFHPESPGRTGHTHDTPGYFKPEEADDVLAALEQVGSRRCPTSSAGSSSSSPAASGANVASLQLGEPVAQDDDADHEHQRSQQPAVAGHPAVWPMSLAPPAGAPGTKRQSASSTVERNRST